MGRTEKEAEAAQRTSLMAWSETHAQATFAEMEQAVEARLDLLRAELMQQAVDWAAAREVENRTPVPCPECGQALESHGYKERQVAMRGEGTVRLRRRHRVCPACGAGLFPPRPAAGIEQN